jgi:hypothetical protein
MCSPADMKKLGVYKTKRTTLLDHELDGNA